MDVKPIFIIKLPRDSITKDKVDGVRNKIDELGLEGNYYVLIVPYNGEEYDFEAFYPSDFYEKKMEDIKQMVSDNLE